MGAGEDELFFRAYMKLHLLVYCETYRNFENEENLGKYFALLRGVRHLQSCNDLREPYLLKIPCNLVNYTVYSPTT
jgi:hypothetical protein